MRKKQWMGFSLVLMVFWFMAACSKSLMPPEIESQSSVAESDMEGISESMDQGGGAPGEISEGGVVSDLAESGTAEFLQEEDLGPGVGQGELAEAETSIGGAWDDTQGMTGAGSEDGGSMDFAEPSTGEMSTDGMGDGSAGANGAGSDAPGNGPAGQFFAGAGDSFNDGVQEARLLPYAPSTSLEDILFDFDRYDLDDNSRSILKRNANFLIQNSGVKVEIQGHCDERGTNNYNLALGQRRANSTKSYLIAQGIEESRLHIISYGEEKPFCFESSQICWKQNRRAHFMVSK